MGSSPAESQVRRVRLVPLGAAHKDNMRRWSNDPEIARLMGRGEPVSVAEHDVYYAAIAHRDDCAFFAVELVDSGAHIGNVWFWGIDRRHRKAELRVVIGDPAARGKGIGAEAIDLLCVHGFEVLKLHRIYAYVLSINPAAKRAFIAAGFSDEGILRGDRWSVDRFVDCCLLARLSG